MKPTFVGLNPSKVKNSGSKKRFHAWLDYLGLDVVTFVNLSTDPDWDKKHESLDHDHLREMLRDQKLVAWGKGVSEHLTRLGLEEHFVLPHPSGLNRQLNDNNFVIARLEACKEYIYSKETER